MDTKLLHKILRLRDVSLETKDLPPCTEYGETGEPPVASLELRREMGNDVLRPPPFEIQAFIQ